MENGDLGVLKKKLTMIYRSAKRDLLRTESKNIETPTQEFSELCQEIRGFLKGIKKAMDMVEQLGSNTDLLSYSNED